MRIFVLLFFIWFSGTLIYAEDLIYKVKKGDTLSRISLRFTGKYNNYKKIADINNIKNPDLIFVDQILKIPEDMLISNKIIRKKDEKKIKNTTFGIGIKKEDFPELKEENLDEISRKIMEKIKLMREERRKHYIMREKISILSKDNFLANEEIQKIEKQDDSNEFIVKIREEDLFEEKHYDKKDNNRNLFLGLSYHFKYKPWPMMDDEELINYQFGKKITHKEWLIFGFETWDIENNNKDKLEYDRISLNWRIYPEFWNIDNNINFFSEIGIDYYNANYNIFNSNNTLSDNSIGFNLVLGSEYKIDKSIAFNLVFKFQSAKFRFVDSSNDIAENINEAYIGIGTNYFF